MGWGYLTRGRQHSRRQCQAAQHGSTATGALGQQDLPASIGRARKLAAQYQHLSNVPVIPAVEIIATAAEGSPGRDGSCSYQTPLGLLRPWAARASAAGMSVLTGPQAGRASLLAQAKKYAPVLDRPNAGLVPDHEPEPGTRDGLLSVIAGSSGATPGRPPGPGGSGLRATPE